MTARLEQRLLNALDPGEQLSWSGHPRRRILFEAGDAILVLVFLGWWTVIAAIAIDWIGDGKYVDLLVLIPFVGAGVFLGAHLFVVDLWRRIRSSYGLTDRRLLLAGGLLRPRVQSLPLATVTDVTLTLWGGGSGTIAFSPGRRDPVHRAGGPPAFVLIADVERVRDLIVEARFAVFAARQRDALERQWDLPARESAALLWGPDTGDALLLTFDLWEGVLRGTYPIPRGVLGVDPDAVYRLARMAFEGSPVRDGVLLDLERRGLCAGERRKRLGLFPTTRWTLTLAGTAKRENLIARMAIGQGRLGQWAGSDPGRGDAFVAAAGSAILLMRDVFPEIVRLARSVSGGRNTECPRDQRLLDGRQPGAAVTGPLDLDTLARGIRFDFDPIVKAVQKAWNASQPSHGGGGGGA